MVVLVAAPAPDETVIGVRYGGICGSILTSLAITRELELKGSFRFNEEIDNVVTALADGTPHIDPVITHNYPVEQALECLWDGPELRRIREGPVELRRREGVMIGPAPLVVMAVSGCGKSTVGSLLGERLGIPFLDGDDFHPAANKAKMAGEFLRTTTTGCLARRNRCHLASPAGGADSCVIAGSALKRSYRDLLRSFAPDTVFIHLSGDATTISDVLSSREHEYTGYWRNWPLKQRGDRRLCTPIMTFRQSRGKGVVASPTAKGKANQFTHSALLTGWAHSDAAAPREQMTFCASYGAIARAGRAARWLPRTRSRPRVFAGSVLRAGWDAAGGRDGYLVPMLRAERVLEIAYARAELLVRLSAAPIDQTDSSTGEDAPGWALTRQPGRC